MALPITTTPRLVIHGGAGNITRSNLPRPSYDRYAKSLLVVTSHTSKLLLHGASALSAATHAVAMMEDNPLFNCGKGAVFARDGTIELEASVMVSNGYHKRGCGIVLVKRIKNPIYAVREMLIRGGTDGAGSGDPAGDGGGAQGHCCLGGAKVEELAKKWGCEIVAEDYFWTRKRWEQHKRGLGDDGAHGWEEKIAGNVIGAAHADEEEGWDGHEYLPQGTVGCVALDRYGTLCVATSTGGLTNKLPGRIGDTPTLGAGFWAEEWEVARPGRIWRQSRPRDSLAGWLPQCIQEVLGSCVRRLEGYAALEPERCPDADEEKAARGSVRAVAMSGTGNGDFFLRLAATRTAAAMVRFSPARSLASAVRQIVGPGGEMQRSAGDRWGASGEGEGGIIGIEVVGGVGKVVFDFNCGGMFRGWVDERGSVRVRVFKEEY